MRPRRRLETAEQEAIKAAVRQSFQNEEKHRDRIFEEQCNRLLKNLDEFEKRGDRGPPA